ncbi:hypothetical protein [Isoptericola sp. NPDC019482]|uniref:hypothetical protein n=1 Tax=Isoptericola sp. NPDC019482 TaxID=3154688 RepID=UPI003497BB79
MSDLMKRLGAADPARRADLEAVDEAAFAALREEITMTSTDGATAPTLPTADGPLPRRRRLGRRGAVAIGLAAVLTGGGVAYAAIQAFQGSSGEGVTCVHVWDEDTAEGLNLDAAGSWITGDPYADCTTLLAAEGLPPIDDPVAFAWDGQTIVAPADQVPEGVQRLEGTRAVEGGVVELQRSVADTVDGGRSGCRTVPEAVAWAEGEIDRLGLQDWTVVTPESDPAPDAEPGAVPSCSDGEVHAGDRQIVLFASDDPFEQLHGPGDDPTIDALRERIVDECVPLDEARAVVDEVYADEEYEVPTTEVVDDGAACARVDLVEGGMTEAFVYGPGSVS